MPDFRRIALPTVPLVDAALVLGLCFFLNTLYAAPGPTATTGAAAGATTSREVKNDASPTSSPTGRRLVTELQALAALALTRALFGGRSPSSLTRAAGRVVDALTGAAPASPPDRAGPGALAGMALVAMALLLLELLLTRLFSVTLYYHFAFMAISLALFGLSASGVLVYVFARLLPPERARPYAALFAVGFVVTAVAGLFALLRLHVALTYSPDNFITLLRIYLVAAIPFVLGGMSISLLLTHYSRSVGPLYTADLGGAALGCLVLLPAVARLGAPGAVLLAALVAAAGAVALAAEAGARRLPALAGAVAVAVLGLLVASQTGWKLDVAAAKGTQQTGVVFSKWNAFSRVAVYDRPHETWGLSPSYRKPLPATKWLDIDASASTPLTHWTGRLEELEHLKNTVTSAAYAIRPGKKTLIIGAGGGRDVLAALAHGSKDVTAVEYNPVISIDVMRRVERDFTGDLYHRPEVHPVVEEGRTFVRQSSQRFDVIQMSLVDTWAATSAGAYILAENNLYTVEAMVDYLGHLAPDGVLAVSRWREGSLRMASLYREAARRLGIAAPEKNVVVLRYSNLLVLLFKQHAFSEDELATLRGFASTRGFAIAYDPGTGAGEYRDLLAAPDTKAVLARYKQELGPVTDDRPFFFHFTRLGDVPELVKTKKFLFGDGLTNLVSVLAVSLVLVLLTVALPAAVALLRRRGRAPGLGALVAYFACLGLGFITVEIAVLQKLTLVLGHPVYSLTVSIFALLLGGGTGAFLAGRRPNAGLLRDVRLRAVAVIVVIAILVAILPALGRACLATPLGIRILAAVLVVAPLGVLMGHFLPLGVRLADRAHHDVIPWLWAVNGATSVLGSGLAILLAMYLGFSVVLLIGSGLYLLALVTTFRIRG